MDIKQLRQFAMLATTLNFRRAAERLGIAQPALSVSLRRLEQELGVSLFERSRHGVTLTQAGAAALPEARQIIERVDRMRHNAQAGAEGEAGTVRLGFVGTAAYDLLPRALVALRSNFPGIQVDLHESTSHRIESELLDGGIDIGIVRFPTRIADGLALEKIETDRIGVALGTGHPLTRSTDLDLEEMAGEAFVFPSSSQSPSLYHALLSRCLAAGFSPRIVQEVSHIQTIIGLVQGGVGIALLPDHIATAFASRIAFRTLGVDRAGAATGLGLLYRPATISRSAENLRRLMIDLAHLNRRRDSKLIS